MLLPSPNLATSRNPTAETLPWGNESHASQAPWPYQLLDIDALHNSGWRPTAFSEFVLKISQRCNLACDYCYVYTMADQSWRDRPALMSERVWSAAVDRIAEHVAAHRMGEVRVILHGGEPLLAGADRIAAIATQIKDKLPPQVTARIAMQTNATLLDEDMLETLGSHDIKVGVSLDGAVANHDRHRFHRDRRGSFEAADRGLRLLRNSPRRVFSGILSVIDPSSDPVECYETLLGYDPPALDFLLPHANWSTRRTGDPDRDPAFGHWLTRVFDRWYDAPRKETRIRLFEEMINAILGGQSRSSDIGLSRSAVVVVESDGAIEQADILKSTYPGAAATGLSVFSDPFDEALGHPGFVARQIGAEALSDTCRTCAIHQVCGGGQYAHRFRQGTGFRNPSGYCRDLAVIITHAQHRIQIDVKDSPSIG